MKAVVVLMDSLNRHFLPVYGNDWVRTPAIDRFAERSIIFDNCWLGSAPCMPARRDMLTGRLNFLERGWGGMEPFDVSLPQVLHKAGIHSHMETDHYHYFQGGGEFYTTEFSTWRSYRGQENDPCATPIADPPEPEHLGKWAAQYAKNHRQLFKKEADFSSPSTFAGAIEWLEMNREADDFLLWVEAFDPHEPFDCPEEFLELYEDDWRGPRYDWSGYEKVDEMSDATGHLRRQYAACLTMMDRWFGKLMQRLRELGLFDDTLIILTTDHGHLLGEHGATGKNRWHCWNELAHIPHIVHLPGHRNSKQHRHQLIQNIDIFPTLCEFFETEIPASVRGASYLDIARENAPAHRDGVLFGWYGKTVNVSDGRHAYFRAPVSRDNMPLNQYLLMPTRFHGRMGTAQMNGAKLGRFLKSVDCPVIRMPRHSPIKKDSELLETRLFDISADYGQKYDLIGAETDAEKKMKTLLVRLMREADSPEEQFERLGLTQEKS